MLQPIPGTPWKLYERDDHSIYLELEARVTGGVGLELEVFMLRGRTIAAWLVSDTGEALSVVKGARC